MAGSKKALGILFGVKGGSSINQDSGALILKDLKSIVTQINKNSGLLPGVTIQLDATEAKESIKSLQESLAALEKQAKEVKIPALADIGASLAKISENTSKLYDDLGTKLIASLSNVHQRLDNILESLPDTTNETSKSVNKAIKSISESIQSLVDDIGNLSEVVERISNKPSSIVNNIAGGSTEDTERLELLKTQARETIQVYEELYQIFDRNLSNPSLDKAFRGSYPSYSSLLSAKQRFDTAGTKAWDTSSGLSGATTSAAVKQVTDQYKLLVAEIGSIINKANQIGGDIIPLPDPSKVRAAAQAIEEYDAKLRDAGDEPQASSEESKSILEKAREISNACTQIEERLDALRAKIEATFDFTNINPDVSRIIATLDTLSEHVGKAKEAVAKQEVSVRQATYGDATEEWKLKKTWMAAEKEHNKEVREETRKRVQEEAKLQADNFEKYKNTVKEFYKNFAEMQRLVSETSHISFDEDSGEYGLGTEKGADAYAARVAHANELVKAMKELGFVLDPLTGIVIRPTEEELEGVAKKLGVTEEAIREVYDIAETENQKATIKLEKNAQIVSASTDKQVRNIRATVLRMYDTIAKDKGSKALADNILKMTSSGKVNVQDLRREFDKFSSTVAANGADIETWGQKFKKAFANHVRSALASVITLDVGQVLRGIYDNVVKLDDAVVNLQIATGKTRTETKKLVKEYSSLAKELKTTTAEIAESADTWLRQGYSTKDTETLIKNSTMLSKLGQMEAEEASTALTSAMKGYNVAVEESIGIVDKLTAVDMEAAASAGGIATAMAETAASAKLAGVSMDTLIGYIATVKEVTQDSDESVGTFMKTMLARMGNIKVGKFVDENGESLNDVETVLDEVGIKLRSSNNEFRNFSEVLDEVGAKWDGYDDVQKHAIATAIAGTRQQEKFLTLMSNYGTALDYATTAMGAAGTATEKYKAYTEGVTAHVNGLTAAFEKFSVIFLDSDLVAGVLDFGTGLLDIATGAANVIDWMGGLPTLIFAVASAFIVLKGGLIAYKAEAILVAMANLTLKSGIKGLVSPLTSAIAAWNSYRKGVVSASTAMQATAGAVGWVIGAMTVLIGITSAVKRSIEEARQKKKEMASAAAELSFEVADLTNKYLDLNEAVKEDKSVKEDFIKAQDDLIEKLKLEKYEIDELIKKYGSYSEALKEASATELESQRPKLLQGYQVSAKELERAFKERYNRLESSLVLGESYSYISSGKARYDEDAVEWKILQEFEKAGYSDLISYDKLIGSYSIDLSDRIDLTTTEGKLSAVELLDRLSAIASTVTTEENKILKDLQKRTSGLSDEVTAYAEGVKNLNNNAAQVLYLREFSSIPIPETQALFEEYRQGFLNAAIASGQFVGTTKDIEDAIDEMLKSQSELSKFYGFEEPAADKLAVSGKTILEILNSIQPGYDGLVEALSTVTSEGYLTAEGLESVLELVKENKLAGLELEDILQKDAKGYRLVAGAVDKYIDTLVAKEVADATGPFATPEDAERAIANLRNFLAVLEAVIATQKESGDTGKEGLEKQRDLYDEQLDKYKGLIDLRKELLETYADELDYQRELEKKQKNVASLQTKLAVARLDNSAAGQARVRELESQLQKAQEELDDFTLEHAIEVLEKDLESQYSEYENFIKGELQRIEGLLEGIKDVGDGAALDSEEIKGYIATIQGAISDAKASLDKMLDLGHRGDMPSEAFAPGAQATLTNEQAMLKSIQEALNKELYDDKIMSDGVNASAIRKYYSDTWKDIMNLMFLGNRGRAISLYEKLLKEGYATYHSGGFVGDSPALGSNEEFAKLLQGEFVSTPSQIRTFMQKTLPQVANYGSSNRQEFHAPLVEITCESVTTESLPKLREIVDEAVDEIKKCLDSGMSRTGYKRSVKKLLT